MELRRRIVTGIVIGIGVLLVLTSLSAFVLLQTLLSPLTPEGGTRLSIFCAGYPVEAVTTELTRESYGSYYAFILSNPPVARTTVSTGAAPWETVISETELFQWNVETDGTYYWARAGFA